MGGDRRTGREIWLSTTQELKHDMCRFLFKGGNTVVLNLGKDGEYLIHLSKDMLEQYYKILNGDLPRFFTYCINSYRTWPKEAAYARIKQALINGEWHDKNDPSLY